MQFFRFVILMMLTTILLIACGSKEGEPQAQLPTAPTNVVAVAGEGFVNVSWEHNGEGVSGFAIHRSTTGSSTGASPGTLQAVEVGRVSGSDRSFRDENVEPGVGYRYGVSSVDSDGKSSAPATPANDEPVTPEPEPEPVSLEKSLITATPATAQANGTSAVVITVTLRLANEELVGRSAGTVTLGTTRGTLSTVTDNKDGTYTASLTSTNAGQATVSAKLDGADLTASASVTFTSEPVEPEPEPAEPDLEQSEVLSNLPNMFADGLTPATIIIVLRDSDGAELGRSAGTVTVETTFGELSSVVDHENGAYSARIRSAETGTATVSATLDGQPFEETVTVEFILPPSLPDSTLTASASPVFADGESESVITVTIRNIEGDPVGMSAGTVTMSSSVGTLSAVTNNEDGTYTASLTSDTKGTAVVSATLLDATLTETAEVVFDAVPDPTQSIVSIEPDLVFADGLDSAAIQVQLRDADGEAVTRSGGTVTVTASRGNVSEVTDNGDGTYSATINSTQVGESYVTVQLGTHVVGTPPELLFEEPPALEESILTAEPDFIAADGTSTSTMRLELFTSSGYPITRSAGTVVFSTTSGTISESTDHGNGSYTALLSADSIGIAEVTAELNGTPHPVGLEIELLDPEPPAIDANIQYVRPYPDFYYDSADPQLHFEVLVNVSPSSSPTEVVHWLVDGEGLAGPVEFLSGEAGLILDFQDEGDYEIYLTATNRAGKSDTQAIQVQLMDSTAWWYWDETNLGVLSGYPYYLGRDAGNHLLHVDPAEPDRRYVMYTAEDYAQVAHGEIEPYLNLVTFETHVDGYPSIVTEHHLRTGDYFYTHDGGSGQLVQHPVDFTGTSNWSVPAPYGLIHATPSGSPLVTSYYTYGLWPSDNKAAGCVDTQMVPYTSCFSSLVTSYDESTGAIDWQTEFHYNPAPTDAVFANPNVFAWWGYSSNSDIFATTFGDDGTIYVAGTIQQRVDWAYPPADTYFSRWNYWLHLAALDPVDGHVIWQSQVPMFVCDEALGDVCIQGTHLELLGNSLALSGDTLYLGVHAFPYEAPFTQYPGAILFAASAQDGQVLWREEHFGHLPTQSVDIGFVTAVEGGEAVFALQTNIPSFLELTGLPADRSNLVLRRYSSEPGGPVANTGVPLTCSSLIHGFTADQDWLYVLDHQPWPVSVDTCEPSYFNMVPTLRRVSLDSF